MFADRFLEAIHQQETHVEREKSDMLTQLGMENVLEVVLDHDVLPDLLAFPTG